VVQQNSASGNLFQTGSQKFAPLIIVTLMAGAAGGFLGTLMTTEGDKGESATPSSVRQATKSREYDGRNAGHEESTPKDSTSLQFKELAPIVTNLGDPKTSWIRLQAAILFDGRGIVHQEEFFAEAMADIVAFLRTLSLSSLEGADGLRWLNEELNDRLATRSNGSVRELIIQTIVVQ
jgi:flagellar basal body-associated protein FliL